MEAGIFLWTIYRLYWVEIGCPEPPLKLLEILGEITVVFLSKERLS